MTLRFQIILIVGVFVFLMIIIRLIKKSDLSVKYALLWFAASILMLAVSFFPELVTWLAHIFGIYSVVNTVFVIAGIFALSLILSLSVIASKQSERIKQLAQYSAIMELRIRELEARCSIMNQKESKE